MTRNIANQEGQNEYTCTAGDYILRTKQNHHKTRVSLKENKKGHHRNYGFKGTT